MTRKEAIAELFRRARETELAVYVFTGRPLVIEVKTPAAVPPDCVWAAVSGDPRWTQLPE